MFTKKNTTEIESDFKSSINFLCGTPAPVSTCIQLYINFLIHRIINGLKKYDNVEISGAKLWEIIIQSGGLVNANIERGLADDNDIH